MAALKPPLPEPTSAPDEAQTFTSAMRIFGGIAWGTITALAIAVVLIIIPQVPRPWLWGVLPSWVGLVSLGILLQWSIARGNCPKCGQPMVVPAQGKRCPKCRSYLKAVDRSIVKVA
jgi:energy-coupling factor transporter transmembrane protein EcfT